METRALPSLTRLLSCAGLLTLLAASAPASAAGSHASAIDTLSSLNNPAAHDAVQIRVVPVTVTRGADGSVTGVDHRVQTTGVAVRMTADRDYFIIEVKVTGKATPVHISVLDLQPGSSRVSEIWPAPDAAPSSDLTASDGQWHTLQNGDAPALFQAEKPYGKEVYQAIATTSAADLAEAVSPDVNTRAPLTPIGMLIKKILGGSPKPTPPSGSDWAAGSATVRILPER